MYVHMYNKIWYFKMKVIQLRKKISLTDNNTSNIT